MIDDRHQLDGALALEQGPGVRSVCVHAIEAVVPCGDGRRKHFPLVAAQRGAGVVLDEQLVGEAPYVVSHAWRQADRRDDAGRVGKTPNDRCFL